MTDSEFRSVSSFEADANTPNILIVGETGVGKSSIVNLIAGEPLAEVNYDANTCTLEATSYILSDREGLPRRIRLFDTAGMNEPQLEKTGYFSAIEKANALIGQLQKTGGISLLLFCIRAGRITASTQTNYRLFCDILCQKKVPVVLVVTGLENVDPMEKWWEQNESVVKTYGLSCALYTCITTIRGLHDCFAERYDQSQTKMRSMLLMHATANVLPWQAEQKAWFIHLAGKLLNKLRRGQFLTEKELASHLQRKCKFTKPDAKYLASKILAERQEGARPDFMEFYAPDISQTFHVILFGEAGVGKSSLVNLIAGEAPAETSPGPAVCTPFAKSHRVVLEDRLFHICDTVGLDEPETSPDDYVRAVKQVYKLIKELERREGDHLLLLCMRGGRITESLQQNYNLFTKVLCGEKVPLWVVVTHLEREPRMDDWWTENAEELEKHGISADEHACITAVSWDNDAFRRKYEESRGKMRKLLLDSKPKLPREKKMLPRRTNQPTAQELEMKLVRECGFSDSVARAIATSIVEIDQLPPGSDK